MRRWPTWRVWARDLWGRATAVAVFKVGDADAPHVSTSVQNSNVVCHFRFSLPAGHFCDIAGNTPRQLAVTRHDDQDAGAVVVLKFDHLYSAAHRQGGCS